MFDYCQLIWWSFVVTLFGNNVFSIALKHIKTICRCVDTKDRLYFYLHTDKFKIGKGLIKHLGCYHLNIEFIREYFDIKYDHRISLFLC